MIFQPEFVSNRIAFPNVVCWAPSLELIGYFARLHVKTLLGQATVGAEPEAERHCCRLIYTRHDTNDGASGFGTPS